MSFLSDALKKKKGEKEEKKKLEAINQTFGMIKDLSPKEMKTFEETTKRKPKSRAKKTKPKEEIKIVTSEAKSWSELSDEEKKILEDTAAQLFQFAKTFLGRKKIRQDHIPYILMSMFPYLTNNNMKEMKKLKRDKNGLFSTE